MILSVRLRVSRDEMKQNRNQGNIRRMALGLTEMIKATAHSLICIELSSLALLHPQYNLDQLGGSRLSAVAGSPRRDGKPNSQIHQPYRDWTSACADTIPRHLGRSALLLGCLRMRSRPDGLVRTAHCTDRRRLVCAEGHSDRGWDRTHQYCGHRATRQSTPSAKRCPRVDEVNYPRLRLRLCSDLSR